MKKLAEWIYSNGLLPIYIPYSGAKYKLVI